MYEGRIFRPPSEAKSLILQITVGCRHNACTFCSMYKEKQFRIKSQTELVAIIKAAKQEFPLTEKIFLADGDALTVETPLLCAIVQELYQKFPQLKRVSAYASPKDVLAKSSDELSKLKDCGLDMLYLGVESGSARVLHAIRKGVTPLELIEAGQRVVHSGLKLSTTVIIGLGGKEHWEEHARETAKVVSEVQPNYLGALTLMLERDAPLYQAVQNGAFQMLTPLECLVELRLMLSSIEVSDCVFRSNHASNYLALKGNLPRDKASLLRAIDQILVDNHWEQLAPEWRRGL